MWAVRPGGQGYTPWPPLSTTSSSPGGLRLFLTTVWTACSREKETLTADEEVQDRAWRSLETGGGRYGASGPAVSNEPARDSLEGVERERGGWRRSLCHSLWLTRATHPPVTFHTFPWLSLDERARHKALTPPRRPRKGGRLVGGWPGGLSARGCYLAVEYNRPPRLLD